MDIMDISKRIELAEKELKELKEEKEVLDARELPEDEEAVKYARAYSEKLLYTDLLPEAEKNLEKAKKRLRMIKKALRISMRE